MNKIAFFLMWLLLASPSSANDGKGISSWAGWKSGQVSRTECPELRSVPLILKWNQLEPTPGKYAFEKHLGERGKP